MKVKPSSFRLQTLFRVFPSFARRIKACQTIARLTGSQYQIINFDKGTLVANVADSNVASYLLAGSFADYGFFGIVEDFLKPGDVYVDLGANYGFHTFGISGDLAKALRHIVIDANPDCIGCLESSAELHPMREIIIQHLAASSEDGEIEFSYDPADTGSGHVGDGTIGCRIRVPTRRLDEVLPTLGVQFVSFLKVDIEGSELKAFQGLSRFFESQSVGAIYFELNPKQLRLQETEPYTVLQELRRHGFQLFWPNDDVEWIKASMGGKYEEPPVKKRWTVGKSGRQLVEFELDRYFPSDRQFDLLAVSQKSIQTHLRQLVPT